MCDIIMTLNVFKIILSVIAWVPLILLIVIYVSRELLFPLQKYYEKENTKYYKGEEGVLSLIFLTRHSYNTFVQDYHRGDYLLHKSVLRRKKVFK